MDAHTLKAVVTIAVIAFMSLWIIFLRWRVQDLKLDKLELQIENMVLRAHVERLRNVLIGIF